MSNLHHSHIENILCIYDFSESNETSLMHAITMAQKFKAKLYLLNNKEPYSTNKIPKGNYNDTAKEAINKITEPYRFTHGVAIDIIIEEGKYETIVKQIVDEKSIDIIVLDIDNYKGRNPFFSSSNIPKFSQFIKIPILAVKSNSKNYNYQKVLFPLDDTQSAREKIPYAKRIGEVYPGAEVVILGLDSNSLEHAKAKTRMIIQQAKEYVNATVKNIKVYLESTNNKTKTTIDIINIEHPDIVIVMSDGGGLFTKSRFERIIESTDIPVVVVPPRVEMVAGRVGL